MTSTRIEEIRQRAEAATPEGPVVYRQRFKPEHAYRLGPNATNNWQYSEREAIDPQYECQPLYAEPESSDVPFLLDHITKLEERCEGYKGQVKAGGEEIERLRAEREELAAMLWLVRPFVATSKSWKSAPVLEKLDALFSRTGDETP